MPYISTEALVGGALLIVLAVGYQYLPKHGASSGKATKKKGNKKKAKQTTAEEDRTETPLKTGTRSKRKSDGSGGEGTMQSDNTVNSAVPITKGTENATPSFAAIAGNLEGTKPKTLAQKLAPQPRKTEVDDMLAPEDRPATHVRVRKVTPSAPPPAPSVTISPILAPPVVQKLAKFEGDYLSSSEDETSGTVTAAEIEEDDGWDVVPSKKKKPVSLSLNSGSSQSVNNLAPLPVSTKLQKKNAKNAEAKKAARAADEAERQRRLAMHKRDIEKERINDIYAQKKSTNATKSALGGGAKATVDANGKLIWD